MPSKSIENLICEYTECQLIHSNIDYADSRSVKTANKAADRMRKVAIILAKKELGREAFEKLLTSNNQGLSLWVAHHLLEFMHPDQVVQNAALTLIAAAASGDSAHALGEAMWLEAWRSNHAT